MPKLRALAARMRAGGFRLRWQRCPACGVSAFAKLFNDETGVRCMRCGATPVHLAVIEAVASLLGQRAIASAYEMSTHGALLKYLRKTIARVETSEYIDGVEPGTVHNGVRCEDVQRLSFQAGQFDLCTSTEVFEHVPNDAAGFAEVRRVLRQGGSFIFTVPLGDAGSTVERASIVGGKTSHLLPPAYHGDRLRGAGKVLVFRDYGLDICDRILAAGFSQAVIADPSTRYFGFGRKVVVATR